MKILLIGNNCEHTDSIATMLAKDNSTTNNGLIDTENFQVSTAGYYHTSVADLAFGEIIQIAPQFNLIKLSDQPIDQWSHHRVFLQSYKLMRELDNLGLNTDYKDNKNVKKNLYFDNLLTNNPSFCMFPWMTVHPKNGYYYPCSRFREPVKKLSDIKDFATDKDLAGLRNNMLHGIRIDACKTCYNYEDKGIESYRQFESKDWISQIGIESLDDLHKITSPYYYEIFVNNTCNIMCRSCEPNWSHLIAQEAVDHGIIASDYTVRQTLASTDVVAIDTLTKKSRVYLHGGEPTVIKEVYDFMQKCIDQGKTDFQLAFCTNGQKLSKKFLFLLSHFSNTHLSFSIDAYGKINDYWRHGSNWETIVANMKTVDQMGCKTSFNTVPGIYNATNLHLLLEFADEHFPKSTFYMQINNRDSQDVYNHPDSEAVCRSMERCMQTNVYYSDGKSNKTCIDSIYNYYSNNPGFDPIRLQQFFEENDRLDKIRNSYLKDYIPELDACRRFLQ